MRFGILQKLFDDSMSRCIHIESSCRLEYRVVMNILKEFKEKGLVGESDRKYFITQKGCDILRMRELINDFLRPIRVKRVKPSDAFEGGEDCQRSGADWKVKVEEKESETKSGIERGNTTF